MTALLSSVVSEHVAFAEKFLACDANYSESPEGYLVAHAVLKRRIEFNEGRNCAHKALSEFGYEDYLILRGEKGQPIWPKNIVGSITHCSGYCAAVVGQKFKIKALGIDAEPHEIIGTENILTSISLQSEREILFELNRFYPEIHWDKVLFSAKETTYKIWFPLTRAWLGFQEANIVISPPYHYCPEISNLTASGSFTVTILVPTPDRKSEPLKELTGRWLIKNNLIITYIELGWE